VVVASVALLELVVGGGRILLQFAPTAELDALEQGQWGRVQGESRLLRYHLVQELPDSLAGQLDLLWLAELVLERQRRVSVKEEPKERVR
jgi:hypothetical protein